MTAPTFTPCLHTARGEKINPQAVIGALGATFLTAAVRHAQGASDHVRITLALGDPEMPTRLNLTVKRVVADAYTVELGRVDLTTSLPTYDPMEQREGVSLDDLADVAAQMYAIAALGEDPIPDTLPEDFA